MRRLFRKKSNATVTETKLPSVEEHECKAEIKRERRKMAKIRPLSKLRKPSRLATMLHAGSRAQEVKASIKPKIRLYTTVSLPGVIDLGNSRLTKKGAFVQLQKLQYGQAKYNGKKVRVSKQCQKTGMLRVTLHGVHRSLVVRPGNLREIPKGRKEEPGMSEIVSAKKAAGALLVLSTGHY
jgi:hypothetical protein